VDRVNGEEQGAENGHPEMRPIPCLFSQMLRQKLQAKKDRETGQNVEKDIGEMIPNGLSFQKWKSMA